MLPKSQRIPRKAFTLLLNGAKTFKNSLLLLRFVQNPEKSARFGFSVSKKISKSAVIRNRLRRMGYRSLKQYLPLIQIKAIISFSFRTIPKNQEEVAENIKSILKESKLIPLEVSKK